jgi:hypothetical protein
MDACLATAAAPTIAGAPANVFKTFTPALKENGQRHQFEPSTVKDVPARLSAAFGLQEPEPR